MKEYWKSRIIDTLLILSAFAVIITAALLIAVCVSPDCLGSAYVYSTPAAIKDCTMVKTPDPTLLKKERVYLEWIAKHQWR